MGDLATNKSVWSVVRRKSVCLIGPHHVHASTATFAFRASFKRTRILVKTKKRMDLHVLNVASRF